MLVYVRSVIGSTVMGVSYNPTVLVKYENSLYEVPFSEIQETDMNDTYVVDDSLLNYESLVRKDTTL